MKNSWHENDFRITGPLLGESTDVPVESPHKGQVMRSFDVYCAVSQTKLFDLSSRWFETPWPSCDAIAITVTS